MTQTPRLESPDLSEATISQLRQHYSSGRWTPSQVIEEYLRRVQSLDLRTQGTAPPNCILHIDPSIRRQADQLDRETETAESRVLYGVPVWVKDSIDVRDLPTTCGSLALEDNIAEIDALLITKLREAGAIIMGKVGMTELGRGNNAFSTMSGRIGNSFDPRNPPGGSSSGSAVATSLNLGMAAVGVDDCSSITDPASRNACVGLRPTVGLISRHGIWSASPTDTTPGPIARTVKDAAVLLDVMSERSAQSTGFETGSYSEEIEAASLRDKRIGVLDQGDYLDKYPVDYGTRFASVLRTLRREGATVIPNLRIDGLVSKRYTSLEYYNSMVTFLRNRRTAPRTIYELTSSERVGPLVKRAAGRYWTRFGLPRFPLRVPNLLAPRCRRTIRHNRRQLESLMARHDLDCLVTATTIKPALWATISQVPHLTVPGGFARVIKEDPVWVLGTEIPTGVSFLGPPWSEQKLLEIGSAFESAVSGRRRPAGAETDFTTLEDLNVDRFNHLKRQIGLQSHELLQLGKGGYSRPTHEEFREVVDQVKRSHGEGLVG
jgi:Asp-tRNA(Asn)/Glu-tRNA(Gln) amidotransferase A subunit family amidase